MRLKLVSLTVSAPSPFLFFLPQLKATEIPYTLTKLSYQEDKELLLDEKGWKIKLDTKDCKNLGQVNYTKATKFVVKCQDHSEEFTFPAYARLYEDSINFWIEIEKEEFSDNLIHFYSFFWSKGTKEETHKPISDNCLFEGTYNNEHSLCLASWKELNNLLQLVKRNKDMALGELVYLNPNT
ncbi:hypothetical protein DNK47_02775 [Mycoplasma wenyonii]|uniref:Uncharacterized protein n=1 Tax=Mycoplasma wenyonii TaxID=65123 RepID=A0A328PRB3_9MOLU|nr:hypothetical protein [Mycoplasma wenyonii]RAO94867.1 hypothetical protein DNK47_02775 [Mycoplasma wenyonii]